MFDDVLRMFLYLLFFSCPCTAINVISVQYNGGFLPDIVLFDTAFLKAEVWVETVTEGGRRFMAAWRKEEVDAARHSP